MKLFVCRFAQQWESFRLPELESVAKMQNVAIQVDPQDYSDQVTLLFDTQKQGALTLNSFSARF